MSDKKKEPSNRRALVMEQEPFDLAVEKAQKELGLNERCFSRLVRLLVHAWNVDTIKADDIKEFVGVK